MIDLTTWLLTQIDADERVADRALDVSTDLGHQASWSSFSAGDVADEAITHVEAWSPDRVLAECEAKRRIVDLHPVVGDDVCDTCVVGMRGYPAYPNSKPERWPCGTLRALALGYADRPGYQQDWRP
jgi:hypothetical protein